MTGDDSYHAHCFKCKVCQTRIDELVFAKTSQGIYCMGCHNERMAKIRRHAQKKREKEKAAGSSKSRERTPGEFGVCFTELEVMLTVRTLTFSARLFLHEQTRHFPLILRCDPLIMTAPAKLQLLPK